MPAKLKWAGDGPRVPTTIHWPSTHRERHEREAAARGLSLNEYVIRTMAELSGLIAPTTDGEGEQLPLGA
jgi:hypothetical protein